MRRIWEELRKSFECSNAKYQKTLQQRASMSGVLQVGGKGFRERDGEIREVPAKGLRLHKLTGVGCGRSGIIGVRRVDVDAS